MTHAQQTQATTGSSTLLPAAVAALVMAAALAIGVAMNGLPSFSISTNDAGTITTQQSVLDAGRAWQLQREQQSGVGVVSSDVLKAARDWEAQRRAQSVQPAKPFIEPPGL